jgi:peptide/nickel transport system substrate-binding protein
MQPAFRILGPLEVTLDERPVALGGGRERAILAILLLNIGEVVSVERLIDGVWGDARPTSAKHMVHEYVSRLRQTLDDGSTIATRPPGYLLEAADETLDAREFARITAAARVAAREDRHDEALRSYEQALALWRGETLSDIGLEGDALIAATRLDQERRLVNEERVDCALALGHHLQLIPELEHRVQQAPLRERSRAQLMLALYRAGRQTEALDSYRQGRALLVEQAGVEPGRELRELERAILTHDPALEPASLSNAPRPVRVHVPRGRRLGALLGVALVAVGAAALAFDLTRSGSGHTLAQIDAGSAAAIDPASNRLVREVPVGNGPGRVVAGFHSVWVVNDFDSTVSRIDLTTGNVQKIDVDGDPTAIAIGAGFVWVACTGTRRVLEINPEIDLVVKYIPVGNGPSGIAFSPGAAWVTNRLDDTVTKIDSKSGTMIKAFPAGPSPSDIVYGFHSLWIANETSARLTRLDPVSGGLRTIQVGNGPEAVAVGLGSVWVANSLSGTISRVDPSSNIQTDEIPVGHGPSSVISSDHAIWVADSYGGKVVRIDAATGAIVAIPVGNGPQSLASIGGRIWFSSRQTARVHRGGTLHLFEIQAPDSLDQDAAYASTAWSVSSMTGDGLVGYKRVGGLDGVTLVPDLATSLPLPTNEGRTYTFQLQRGIRYANGDLVRASDIRRALERDVRVNPVGPAFILDLVGGELIGGTCSRSHCDLSRGVAIDDRAGTVTLHLRRPDPELFYKLALPYAYPVPPGVSMTRRARLGVPGTGPYMIRSYEGTRLVLVRNPRFRQWSATAQPDGRPDRIEATYNDALDAQLTAVEHGQADFMESPLPPLRLDEITTRYAAQTHIFPAAKTFGVFLNTKVAPFSSLKARQAFNYAIDRAKAIDGFGGREEAAVTCQILPPGMPGYRPYCPYTRNSTSSGRWVGPDLAHALELVKESGTKRERVLFWTGPLPLELVIGKLAVATLRELGYRATLNIVPDACDGPPPICDTARDDPGYFAEVADSRTHPQAGFDAWAPDYPAASNFLSFFACGAFEPANQNNINVAEICNTQIDRTVHQALTHQTIYAPGASGTRWAAVDHLVTDLGPWAPIVNARDAVVVSRRVGNVQSNPQWGVLFDQMSVR